jgi:hypothetical protein
MDRLIEFVALYVPGKCYGPEYIDFIVGQVDRGYSGPKRWTFLTNAEQEPSTWPIRGHQCRAIPLAEPWDIRILRPGHAERTPYWCFSKLEAFRPDLDFGDRAVLTDLDNFVVGPLDDLLGYAGDFAARQNFAAAETQRLRGSRWQSSWVQYRPAACHDLWDEAREIGEGLHEYFVPLMGGGDQAFLSWFRPCPDSPQVESGWPLGDDLDVLYPGQLASYKWGWLQARAEDRARMRVLYAHGKPKPHELNWRVA